MDHLQGWSHDFESDRFFAAFRFGISQFEGCVLHFKTGSIYEKYLFGSGVGDSHSYRFFSQQYAIQRSDLRLGYEFDFRLSIGTFTIFLLEIVSVPRDYNREINRS